MRCPIASGSFALGHEMAEDLKLQSLLRMMTAPATRTDCMDQRSAWLCGQAGRSGGRPSRVA